jgi:hypothetical protein
MNTYVFELPRTPVVNADIASQTCASGAAASLSSFRVSVLLDEPDADVPGIANDDHAVAARLPDLDAAVEFLQNIR